jgi:hypothetical protein
LLIVVGKELVGIVDRLLFFPVNLRDGYGVADRD